MSTDHASAWPRTWGSPGQGLKGDTGPRGPSNGYCVFNDDQPIEGGFTDQVLTVSGTGAPTGYNTLHTEAGIIIGGGGGTITLTCRNGNEAMAGSADPTFYQARLLATQVETLTASAPPTS